MQLAFSSVGTRLSLAVLCARADAANHRSGALLRRAPFVTQDKTGRAVHIAPAAYYRGTLTALSRTICVSPSCRQRAVLALLVRQSVAAELNNNIFARVTEYEIDELLSPYVA